MLSCGGLAEDLWYVPWNKDWELSDMRHRNTEAHYEIMAALQSPLT